MQPQKSEIEAHSAPAQPLSPLHAMLATLEIQQDAKRLNEICNHPDVHPWVANEAGVPVDLSAVIGRPDTVCLLGEHGGILFQQLQVGLWESHTQVLPKGRGPWALAMANACLHWLFTHTECVEVMTRCPHGNLGAKALAKGVGGVFEFVNPRGWQRDGKAVSADIYSLKIQDWMRNASGLCERGRWFHERLEAEMARHECPLPPHPDDATHDRYVGAATEMFFAGQPHKAVIFYNRWASMSGYFPIGLLSVAPIVVDIQTAALVMHEDTFHVSAVRSANPN